jgi:hypothetical protein
LHPCLVLVIGLREELRSSCLRSVVALMIQREVFDLTAVSMSQGSNTKELAPKK